MKENILDKVANLLKSSSNYITEDGELLKAKVYSDIMTMNEDLLKLLLSDEDIKKTFFTNINGTLVFDKQKFAWLIDSKEFLPDSYTAYTNKIGLTSNNDFIANKNDVVLDFPYKDCVLEGGQTKDDQSRKEIFYNETLAQDEIRRMLDPKVLTNAKRYTKDGVEEGITFNEDDNLIVKGNNLIALASLLKRYEGQVKCIYIDPPFNTGGDSFKYNDKFNRSTWLTFMKNRLLLSKRLLDKKGSILVHIDWHEAHYLKILLDEIFGEDNFKNEIVWHYSSGGDYKNTFAKKHDIIFWYTNSDVYKFFPEDKMVCEKRGTDKKNNMKKSIDDDGRIYFSIKSNGKEYRYYEDDLVTPDDVWEISILQQKDPERTGFFSQKPERLLARVIGAFSEERDTVLDFHSGSGTTAAVAHKMNRKYIGVEQMDSQVEIILNRLSKVIDGDQSGISKDVNWQGGGSFVYCELKENAQELIDMIQACDETKIKEIKEKIYNDDRIIPYLTKNELLDTDKDFEELSLEDKKKALITLVDKNKLYVNYSDIDNKDYEISEYERRFSKSFYEVK